MSFRRQILITLRVVWLAVVANHAKKGQQLGNNFTTGDITDRKEYYLTIRRMELVTGKTRLHIHWNIVGMNRTILYPNGSRIS
jgi:hypothetical protein